MLTLHVRLKNSWQEIKVLVTKCDQFCKDVGNRWAGGALAHPIFYEKKQITDTLSKSCLFNQIKLWYLIVVSPRVPPRFRGLPTALNCIWHSILDGRVHLLKLCWTTSKCIISLFFLAQKLQIMRLFLFPHVFKVHITQVTRNIIQKENWENVCWYKVRVFNMSFKTRKMQGNEYYYF